MSSQLEPQGDEGFGAFFEISAYERPRTTLKQPLSTKMIARSFCFFWYMTSKKFWFFAKNFLSGHLKTRLVIVSQHLAVGFWFKDY